MVRIINNKYICRYYCWVRFKIIELIFLNNESCIFMDGEKGKDINVK